MNGGRRKRPPPRWAQAGLTWFVLSTLIAMGVLYLRATERLSDRVFQPLAVVLCDRGQRLRSRYEWGQVERTNDFGDARERVRDPVPMLGAAECVAPSGAPRRAAGFLAAVWLAAAAPLGCLLFLPLLRRRRR